jgi:dTDP-L-rhamnose 4-epimerase
MNKNVLITGGAGFIGANLSISLIQKGHNVTVLDNLSEQIHGNYEQSPLYILIKDKVNFIKGDVRSKDDWRKAIKGQDIIVHYAAETGTGQSMYEIQKYVDVNIGGTAKMLDILTNEKHQVKKIIIASSRAIYGEGKYRCCDHGVVYPEQRIVDDLLNGDFECKCPFCRKSLEVLPTDENSAIIPSSVYGVTKFQQEQLVMTVCKSLGINAFSFRYQNVYGPGQSLKNPYTGILSIFSNLIRSGKEINIFEDGLESRDFVYIDDVVDATFSGVVNDSINYGIYNVGTGKQINVLQVVEALTSSYGIEINKFISGNFRIGDIRHNYADFTKIKNELGFIPKIEFYEGIKNFTNWVMQQEINHDYYQKSLTEMKEKGLLK